MSTQHAQQFSRRRFLGGLTLVWWRAQGMLVAIACFTMVLATCDLALAQVVRCRPVSERTGEAGCWIMASEPLGQLSRSAVFWHLDTYPTRAAAEARGLRGCVNRSPWMGCPDRPKRKRGRSRSLRI